jgi:uncharacterized protein with ParB-like and HNH nuclease domain
MNKMTIRGAEYPIKKIFSDDFVFTIPLYQRAYSWTTEQSEELLQDLLRAMEGDVYYMPHVCRYILLRLDTQLSEGVATSTGVRLR